MQSYLYFFFFFAGSEPLVVATELDGSFFFTVVPVVVAVPLFPIPTFDSIFPVFIAAYTILVGCC